MEIQSTESGTTIIFREKLSEAELKRIVDLIEYQRILDKSTASQFQLNTLLLQVKKGRWERVKKRLGSFE